MDGGAVSDTRTCRACGQTLPVDEFPVYYDKRSGKHYRRGMCRECFCARNRSYYQQGKGDIDYCRCVIYPPDELRYRPAEQLIECMSVRNLALALGWGKDTAARVKRDPSAYVDTPYEIGDLAIASIRAWLDKETRKERAGGVPSTAMGGPLLR